MRARARFVRLLLAAGLLVLAPTDGPADEPVGLPPGVTNTQRPEDKPLSPAAALARVTVPEGFRATLFAGEPDVMQPIAMATDDRGRLWVVECFSYPNWSQGPPRDRVLIFTDRDGDGRFDSRKVFWDKGRNLTGIALGFGGVWLCSTPELIFLPDRNRDDSPDSPPEVLLDGFNLKQVGHNVVSGMTWGPDGWLYGRHGIKGTSHIGPPGTPDDQRAALNCGIWRFHPTQKKFEIVCHGTTNPWGIDFDDHGQGFFTNNVIGHLWHVIPGARYERMYGQHFDRHLYELMPQCADHLHWAGSDWTKSRGGKGAHDELGGGHSHCGGLIYLGDNWPDEYRNCMLMGNTHGNRVNVDHLHRHGAGYTAGHRPDVFLANDPWFRATCLVTGPDGGVLVSDWNDFGECHDRDGSFRASGRIYKIVYGQPQQRGPLDLATQSDQELVALQTHANDWFVRHARRLLQERAQAGEVAAPAIAQLRHMAQQADDVRHRLRALWTLRAIHALDAEQIAALLDDTNEHVRWWGVTWLAEDTGHADLLVQHAQRERAPLVLLGLASALHRLPPPQRWQLAQALSQRTEIATDKDAPLVLWYALAGHVEDDSQSAVKLLSVAKIPRLRQFLARRLADAGEMPRLAKLLATHADPAVVADIAAGTLRGLRGRRNVGTPPEWSQAYQRLAASEDAALRRQAEKIALVLGDQRAEAALRARTVDTTAPLDERRAAIAALVASRNGQMPDILFKLLAVPELREDALRGLAVYDLADTPGRVLEQYKEFTPPQRQAAVATLVARAASAAALLAAVEEGQVPAADISAYAARQIESHGDKKLTATLRRVWGNLREVSGERRARIAQWKAKLSDKQLAQADLEAGQVVFRKTCAQCHRLYGEGGRIGPDLTGSNRNNLDYLLENIFDPSAVVGRDYRVKNILLADGRLVTGLVLEESDRTLSVATAPEQLVLDRQDIESMRDSPVSMMPEGILLNLSETQVRNLIGFLMHRR